jgi:hypothetical protein
MPMNAAKPMVCGFQVRPKACEPFREIATVDRMEDKDGTAHGNNWARGFMRGMGIRHDGWAELVNDEEHGGCLIPMMMLCHEHDEDPEMRPEPISPEQREEVIMHMAAGLLGAYRYFRAHRQAGASARPSEHHRSTPKVGRNEPCPCGSGKEYERCCGGANPWQRGGRKRVEARKWHSVALRRGILIARGSLGLCP